VRNPALETQKSRQLRSQLLLFFIGQRLKLLLFLLIAFLHRPHRRFIAIQNRDGAEIDLLTPHQIVGDALVRSRTVID
jgi:hypothetical protein